MKKYIASAALLVAISCVGVSQTLTPVQGSKKEHHHKPKLSPAEQSQREAQRVTKQLNLNAEQTAKWEQAAFQRIQGNAPLKEKLNGSTTPEERKQLHAQMRSQQAQFDKDVKGFLSDEQQVAYTDLKHKRHQKKKEHRLMPSNNL